MAINPIPLQAPRTAMRHHNMPEELIDQVIDARIKADPTRLSPSTES
jgi:hypothetical protein